MGFDPSIYDILLVCLKRSVFVMLTAFLGLEFTTVILEFTTVILANTTVILISGTIEDLYLLTGHKSDTPKDLEWTWMDLVFPWASGDPLPADRSVLFSQFVRKHVTKYVGNVTCIDQHQLEKWLE